MIGRFQIPIIRLLDKCKPDDFATGASYSEVSIIPIVERLTAARNAMDVKLSCRVIVLQITYDYRNSVKTVSLFCTSQVVFPADLRLIRHAVDL